jgi:hypothetical protein
MESKSFPSSFDIAGRYAKHRKQYDLRCGERGRIVKTVNDKTQIYDCKSWTNYFVCNCIAF